MKDLVTLAIDEAVSAGAEYADVRIIETQSENIVVRNGEIGSINKANTLGIGVRCIAGGAWGFSSSSNVNREEVQRAARECVEIARASSTLKARDVSLVPEPVCEDIWQTPCLINPFSVSLETKLDRLFKIDRILRKKKRIKVAESEMRFINEKNRS